MRNGGVKLKSCVSGMAVSRLTRMKESGGRRNPDRIKAGKSERIPQKTKNIPVSNKTEIIVSSMSPVVTGKLSRLSSCMNGEQSIISTIRTSTILGNFWSMVFGLSGPFLTITFSCDVQGL